MEYINKNTFLSTLMVAEELLGLTICLSDTWSILQAYNFVERIVPNSVSLSA